MRSIPRELSKQKIWIHDGLSGELWFPRKRKKKNRAILYLHGGGYLIGSPESYRLFIGKLTGLFACDVLALDYRLAPEAPYPSAVNDVLAAFNYMQHEMGYSPHQIIFVGDSAGGGLVVSGMVHLKEAGLMQPAGAICLSPWLDLTTKGESYSDNRNSDVLIRTSLLRKWAPMYANGIPLNDPRISPLFADLSGLPPICIHVSDSEVVYSDSHTLFRKCLEDDVDVTFFKAHEMIHVWHVFWPILDESKKALIKLKNFVDDLLDHY